MTWQFPRPGRSGRACRACRSGWSQTDWWPKAPCRTPSAASRERRVHIVSYLVEYNLADAREIAIAASQEFGAPLLDLDAIQADFETIRLVSEKTIRKHRVLPLVKRGKRLFVAISDPTNLHALDEVKFATGLSVEAIVVEEDKLEQAPDQVARAGRHRHAGTGRRRFRTRQPRSHR